MNLTILLKNCHNNDRAISCLAEFGEVENWKECEKKCNTKFFFGKLRCDFKQINTILMSSS